MLYLIVEVADNVLWHLLFIFITIFTTVILTEITFENIQKVRFILECVGKIISAIYTLHSVLHFVLKYLKVDKGISKMKECL